MAEARGEMGWLRFDGDRVVRTGGRIYDELSLVSLVAAKRGFVTAVPA
jgi:hypothetical protein